MVELLIVVVVLALLTLVSGVTYVATMKTARDGKRKVDLENIRSALEVYRSDNSTYPYVSYYPLETQSLRDILDPSSGKKYISLPTDPKTKQDYFYIAQDCQPINGVQICNSYNLAVTLENYPSSTPPSTTCSTLHPDPTSPGEYACYDPTITTPTRTKCSYCLDPYGLLPVSATTTEGEGVGEIQLPANE